MDFDDLLKQQQAWLDRAGEALKRPVAGAAELSIELRQRRIEGMRAVVERLTRQREETLLRLDAAIAEERTALAKLQKELAGDQTRAPKSPRPTARRPAKASKPKSK